MAGISIQFHALPEELLALAKQCVADFGLHVVAMRAFPFGAIKVRPNELDAVFLNSSPYRELAFSLHEPVWPATSQLNFYDKNPNGLRLDIKRKEPKGLEQTLLTASTSDPVALSVWKKIAKRVKGMTQAGVVGVNPDTGATALFRSFRFSPGAKALEASGVAMLPFAGQCILKLGKPES
jgi:hypothetical protein